MKNNKQQETVKVEKTNKLNYLGLLSLTVAMAEVAATYVFATQENEVLWGIAVVLGLDAAQRLARAFVK